MRYSQYVTCQYITKKFNPRNGSEMWINFVINLRAIEKVIRPVFYNYRNLFAFHCLQ